MNSIHPGGWVRIQSPRSENNTNFICNAQEKAATRGGHRRGCTAVLSESSLLPTNPTQPLPHHDRRPSHQRITGAPRGQPRTRVAVHPQRAAVGQRYPALAGLDRVFQRGDFEFFVAWFDGYDGTEKWRVGGGSVAAAWELAPTASSCVGTASGASCR